MNKNSSDTTGNLNTATESVCPKGWTLPTVKQIDSNRDTANFSPVLGGHYSDTTLYEESTLGTWWSSEVYNDVRRYGIGYKTNDLITVRYLRYDGHYIRCVSEEKTVTDLTYLQDMTGEIADKASGFFISLSRIL